MLTAKDLANIPTVLGAGALPEPHGDRRKQPPNDTALRDDPQRHPGDPPKESHGGLYIGEGLPPIPNKQAKKIESGEFVEMEELLPELWPVGHQEGGEGKTRKSRRITDIFTWMQCFALYSSVRGQHTPGLISELMAYMVSIIRVSREYSGLGWIQYDTLFRKHAALKLDYKWSVINPTLYASCFTGMPREARCELCGTTTHETRNCVHMMKTESTIESRVQYIEESMQVISQQQQQQRNHTSRPRSSGEICRKFNSGGCNYPYCRHTHVCMVCEGPHPEPQCPRGRRQGYKVEPQARRPIKPY